jgi:hypothetical protein
MLNLSSRPFRFDFVLCRIRLITDSFLIGNKSTTEKMTYQLGLRHMAEVILLSVFDRTNPAWQILPTKSEAPLL